MRILVPGKANLTGEAQIPALGTILACRELGHGRNSLAAGIASPKAVSLHTSDGSAEQRACELRRGARLIHSGCGAAWLARLLGVQEVPGSNPGSPTKYLLSGPDT
jgi:hypothetical protein